MLGRVPSADWAGGQGKQRAWPSWPLSCPPAGWCLAWVQAVGRGVAGCPRGSCWPPAGADRAGWACWCWAVLQIIQAGCYPSYCTNIALKIQHYAENKYLYFVPVRREKCLFSLILACFCNFLYLATKKTFDKGRIF